ncbi:hypothetical protein ONZ45_g10012 [Pleurotus djamor]|nr:hypothetical protein ONZ45_g10012 [Pleurotus djamor]
MLPTAAQRALSVPELLYEIFWSSDRKGNASNLLVCRAWAEEVINVEWREPMFSEHLFSLLAPLGHEGGDPYFTEAITQDSWKRFERYARRIKTFILCEEYHPSLYEDIRKSSPPAILLPNVTHFTCPNVESIFRLFAHPGMTSLTLCNPLIEGEPAERVNAVLPRIPELMPRLEDLFFNYHLDEDASAVEGAVVSSLTSLKCLRSVVLAPEWLSPVVTKGLSTLPHLVMVNTVEPEESIEDTDPLHLFSDGLGCNAFPSLNQLEIAIPFCRAIACLSAGFKSNVLKELLIKSDEFESPEDFKTLTEAITGSFPLLFKLTISSASTELPDDEIDVALDFAALKPLLGLRELGDLSIEYTTPLSLSAEDLQTIVRSFKRLICLSLNPNPPVRSPPMLPLSCLSRLAYSQSHVKELELYVDTSPSGLPQYDEMTELKGLTNLSLESSDLDRQSVVPVATYLSRVLPPKCAVDADFVDADDDDDDTEPPLTPWQEVARLVPVLSQALKDGRKRQLSFQRKRDHSQMN